MYVLVLQKQGTHPGNQELIRRSLERSFWEPVWHKKTVPKFLGSENLFKAAFYLAKPFGARLQNFKHKLSRSPAMSDPHAFAVYATECPEEIISRLIGDYSRAGDTVLDPFLGSGTVMKVA
jgi:DNA modification methylase